MKAIIAGGTGWLGGALTHNLLGAGHEVTILSRSAHREGANAARTVWWDGRTPGRWVDEIDGADAVINFTGTPIASGRWTNRRKRLYLTSRVEPTAALVDAMKEAGKRPSVLVSTSAVGYYGDRGDALLDEDAPPGNDFLARLCVAWEAAAGRASELGVRVVLARVGLVLGNGQGALPKLALPFRYYLGGPLGSGSQWIPWVHLDDVVGLYRLAMERTDLRGPMNVTSPHPVTNRELAENIGHILGRPSWFRVPGPVLRVALGELSETLLGGQRALPRVAQRVGYDFRAPNLVDALRLSLRAAV